MPAKGQKKPLVSRFWPKVDKRGPDECWPWVGAKVRLGYGSILGDEEKVIGAHVAAMVLAGRFEPGLDVLHNCNNPNCVNERHLRMGTHRENMHDAIRAGTFRYNPCGPGEKSRVAKLKNDDILEIRRLATTGLSHSQIAKLFPVVRETISAIVRRDLWGHL